MAQERIEIRFTPKGDKAMIRAIQSLDVATKRLQNQTSIYEKELKLLGLTQKQVNTILAQGTKGLRIQAGAFATLRSNLLLYSFGIGLVNTALLSFVKESAKLESVERGFNALSREIGGSSQSLEKLRNATDDTVTDFELMQKANNAVLLGVVKTDDEMAELFDTAQRLGQALGVDTTNALDSMVTGMGRQSKLMLDNLGIVVKSEEAYEKYAQKIGVSANALTDAQKKEAFNQEVLRVSRGMVEKLGDEYLSTEAQIQRMGVATQRLQEAMGEALTPAVEILASALVALSEHFDAQKIKNYGLAIVSVSGAYLLLTKAGRAAAASSLAFLKANRALIGIMLAITAVAEVLDRQFDLFGAGLDDISKDINDLTNSLKDNKDAFIENADEQLSAVEILDKAYKSTAQGQLALIDAQVAQIDAYAILTPLTKEQEIAYASLQDKAFALSEKIKEMNKPDDEEENIFRLMQEDATEALENLSGFFGQYAELSQASAESRIADIDRVANADIAALKKDAKFRKMTDEQKAKAEK